jgi:hypothetical protein
MRTGSGSGAEVSDLDKVFVDERGEVVSPSVLTALTATREFRPRAGRDDTADRSE